MFARSRYILLCSVCFWMQGKAFRVPLVLLGMHQNKHEPNGIIKHQKAVSWSLHNIFCSLNDFFFFICTVYPHSFDWGKPEGISGNSNSILTIHICVFGILLFCRWAEEGVSIKRHWSFMSVWVHTSSVFLVRAFVSQFRKWVCITSLEYCQNVP